MAGRRALQRRPPACRTARERPDGPDLRQPRGPGGQTRSDGVRTGHPRHVRPDGDERRGNRRADRRWAHVRQMPWRRTRGGECRTGTRGRAARGPRAGLEEPSRQRQRRRRDHQRARGRVDRQSDEVGQRVPRELVQVRVGAHDQPCGRAPVDAEESRRAPYSAGCARSGEAAPADDADLGPGAEGRSDLRADRQALPREPGPAVGCVRQSLVQAAAQGHGTALAVSGALGSGAAALAGSSAAGRSSAGRRAGHRDAEAGAAELGPVDSGPGFRCLGLGRELPRHRHAAARTARGSGWPRRRIGTRTSRRGSPGC